MIVGCVCVCVCKCKERQRARKYFKECIVIQGEHVPYDVHTKRKEEEE